MESNSLPLDIHFYQKISDKLDAEGFNIMFGLRTSYNEIFITFNCKKCLFTLNSTDEKIIVEEMKCLMCD
jgi:hypothetical protein